MPVPRLLIPGPNGREAVEAFGDELSAKLAAVVKQAVAVLENGGEHTIRRDEVKHDLAQHLAGAIYNTLEETPKKHFSPDCSYSMDRTTVDTDVFTSDACAPPTESLPAGPLSDAMPTVQRVGSNLASATDSELAFSQIASMGSATASPSMGRQRSILKSGLSGRPGTKKVTLRKVDSFIDAPRATPGRDSITNLEHAGSFEGGTGSEHVFEINLKGDQHTGEITGDAIRVAEALDLHTKFLALDPDRTGVVSVTRFNAEAVFGGIFKDVRLPQLEETICCLNRHLADLHRGAPQELSLETYKTVMLATFRDLVDALGEEKATFVLDIRERIVETSLGKLVGQACRVSMGEAQGMHEGTIKRNVLEIYLEPWVAAVILLNAIVIGISMDTEPDWEGWLVFEFFFTLFFSFELCVKVTWAGLKEHFLGENWAWNAFDFLLVVCAICDTSITVLARFSSAQVVNISSFTVIRLVRLVRITRLVRLLHLRMFRELTLMVNGLIGGLRTLMWAVVFLLVLVYALGVLIRQSIKSSQGSQECREEALVATGSEFCRGAQGLDEVRDVMFGNVGRSMLTVFQCFTDGCTAQNGRPLLWILWDTHGVILVVGYVAVFIFVTFGIFNLILAIFVENTLEYARVSDQSRASRRHLDHLRQARKLNRLLLTLCNSKDEDGTPRMRTARSSNLDKLKGSIGLGEEPYELESHHLNMRVTRGTFEEFLNQQDVIKLFQDLDVSLTSRDHLFDILDSDGNGYLAISELAEGIMRLRGPSDKGDIVSTVLMVRTLQKYVMHFEEAVLHNQQTLKNLVKSIGTVDARIRDDDEDDEKIAGANYFNVRLRESYVSNAGSERVGL